MYRAAIFAACVAVASAFAPTLPATGRAQGANAVSGELILPLYRMFARCCEPFHLRNN